MNENCHKEKCSMAKLRISYGVSGFTLIELLIAMVAGLIVIGATYSIFYSQNKQIDKQDKVVEMQQSVRAAIDMMSREVRMAGYNPTNAKVTFGSYQYNAFHILYNASQLQLRADLNGDGDVNDDNETITYIYDSTNKKITRQKGNDTAENFAENIENFKFSYLSGENPPVSITTAANQYTIRQVRLTITGRTSVPVMGQYPTYTLSADVYARNLAF